MDYKYSLTGGQPVKIYSLDAEEPGTYTAPEGAAFNPVRVTQSGSSGGGGVFVVTKTSDLSTGESTLDKTWQEIYDAIKVNGQYPMVIWEQDDGPLRIGTVFEIGESNGYYGVFACEIAYDFAAAIQVTEFYTQSADGYPSTETD